jgi:aspartate aminotransferase-like enzyme
MTPGPTIVPDRVLKALAKPVWHHRTPEFTELMDNCATRLKSVYKTKNDLFIIPGSGTSAMEAGIVNTVNPGDKVLCLVSGKFSERLGDIALSFGAQVEVMEFDWGSKIDVKQVKEKLTEDIKLLTAVHNETSTGVRNPIKELGELTKQSGTLFLVDAISSMSGDNIEVDNWGIDLCISGSQKCMAMTTGLAFISVSEKAWHVIESNKNSKFYLDLKKYKKKYPQTPFSTPVSLVFGLEEALNMIEEEGLDKRIQRHGDNAKFCRDGVKKLGFDLLPESEEICSQTLTAIKSDKASEIKKTLDEKYDIKVAGGQAHLKDKIFRIGHMGIVGEKEIQKTLDALEEIK